MASRRAAPTTLVAHLASQAAARRGTPPTDTPAPATPVARHGCRVAAGKNETRGREEGRGAAPTTLVAPPAHQVAAPGGKAPPEAPAHLRETSRGAAALAVQVARPARRVAEGRTPAETCGRGRVEGRGAAPTRLGVPPAGRVAVPVGRGSRAAGQGVGRAGRVEPSCRCPPGLTRGLLSCDVCLDRTWGQRSGGVKPRVRRIPAARPLAATTRAMPRDAASIISSPRVTAPRCSTVVACS
jgi:hypothetical protein